MKKTRIGPLPELLAEKGVLPRELARIAGVEVRAVHRLIEGGTKTVSHEKCQAIAAALGIAPGDFCELLALQRSIRSLLRIRKEAANLNGTLTFWRAPELPEARRWAPSRELVQSVVAGLSALLERDFDLPPETLAAPKLRRPAKFNSAANSAAG